MSVFGSDPQYPKMGHGFPRQYVDTTPAEILYDDRILGARATMYNQGETMLRKPNLETTAYTMVTNEGLGQTYYAQIKMKDGIKNAFVQPPWIPIAIELALIGLGLYTFWTGKEKVQKVISSIGAAFGGSMLAYDLWLMSDKPELSYKQEAVSTEE